MNAPIFVDKIKLKATYKFNLNDARIESELWRLLPNINQYIKIRPDIAKKGIEEAKLLFQAIHNEPFFEKQCYTIAHMVPDMPEDKRSNKRLVLSFSIYNEDGKLLIPHLCKPVSKKKGSEYWDAFIETLYPYETFKFLCPNRLQEVQETIKTGDLFGATSVENQIQIEEYSVHDEVIKLTISRKVTVAPYGRGDICVCLPLPDENPDASRLEMVAQGKRLRKNIQSISENLDLRLKQLFISAPPGSGKEGYSTYVHYGSGRKGEPNKVDMTSPREEVEKMLRGSVVERGVILEGLFAKASRGTIIFDEIDKLESKEKDSDRDLSYLLRPLDPGKYLPENGSREMNIDHVAMIFMGSKPPERLKKGPGEKEKGKPISPPDFFTRVSDPWVELQHPLPDTYNDEFNDTFSCLVRYFYWKAVEEMALGETGLENLLKEKGIKRINKLLLGNMQENLDDTEPTTAERRFIAYLKMWLGDFIGSIGSTGRFYLIKSLWFKVARHGWRGSFKKPSVREISKVVRSFVRKNWHSAESKKMELEFPNLINGNSDSNGRKKGQDTQKLADALAASLSKELILTVTNNR